MRLIKAIRPYQFLYKKAFHSQLTRQYNLIPSAIAYHLKASSLFIHHSWLDEVGHSTLVVNRHDPSSRIQHKQLLPCPSVQVSNMHFLCAEE